MPTPVQPTIEDPMQTNPEPHFEPEEETKEIQPPTTFVMKNPETEIDELDDDDKEEIFDALDDGMEPEEAVDHFSDQGLEISLEAVYILRNQQGNEYRNLTEEKMEEINEQYLRGQSV